VLATSRRSSVCFTTPTTSAAITIIRLKRITVHTQATAPQKKAKSRTWGHTHTHPRSAWDYKPFIIFKWRRLFSGVCGFCENFKPRLRFQQWNMGSFWNEELKKALIWTSTSQRSADRCDSTMWFRI
jgi:hypothetical protein